MSQDEIRKERERERKARYRARKAAEREAAEASSEGLHGANEPLAAGVGVSGPTQTSAAASLGVNEEQPPSPSEAPSEDPDQGQAVEAERTESEESGAHDEDLALQLQASLAQRWYERGLAGEPGPCDDELPKECVLAWAQGVWMRHSLREQQSMPPEKLDGRAQRAREYAEFYEHRLDDLPEPQPPRVVLTPPDPATAAKAAKRSSWDG